MTATATITVNRRAVEAIVEQLIELLDTADTNAAIEADKAAQEATDPR